MTKYIKEKTAKSYNDLTKIIQNETDKDLRESFVFRGVENYSYPLIPSSLRKENNKINNYIGNDFIKPTSILVKEAIEKGFVKKEEVPEWAVSVTISLDKNGKALTSENSKIYYNDNGLQLRKELYILLKFLNFADRSGLKVTDNYEVRSNINNYSTYTPDCWPEEKFIEVMSLAQHYGLPTQVLDWSYDFRSSLYFAVKDILEGPSYSDGIIWALNYNLFDARNMDKHYPIFHQLRFYRPEYNRNPNLQAQKGLFTFIIDDINNHSTESLEKRILGELNENPKKGIEHWCDDKIPRIADIPISDDDILFYKIKIPKNEKPSFLKALYADGYSEEYLFPGYNGAIMSIENQVKLEKLCDDI